MSAINGVPATSGAQAVTPTPEAQTATAGLGMMDSKAFLKLLVAQLQYQNPLEPTDPTQMMGQTAQFTQVETLQQLAKTQAQLASLSQTGVATGMVGQEVSAVSADGAALSGVVEAVRFAKDGPVLMVNGAEVPLSAVSEVRAKSATA